MSAANKNAGASGAPPAFAYSLVLILVLIWGTGWPVTKIALDYITPLWMAVLRIVMAIPVMFAILALRGTLGFPPRQDWPIVLTVGMLQMGMFLALVNLGLQFVPSGRAAVLAYTTILFVTPAAIFFLGERPTALKILGLIAGLGGVAMLVLPPVLERFDLNMLIGHLCLLGAAACWSVGIIHIRRHTWATSPLFLAPWQMMCAAVPLAIWAWIREDVMLIRWGDPELWLVMIYLGPIGIAIGFWAVQTITRILPAISTSLALLGVPAVALIVSTVWLREALPFTLLAGAALIFLSVALVAIADHRAARGSPKLAAESDRA